MLGSIELIMIGSIEIILIIIAFLLVLSVLAFLFYKNRKCKENQKPKNEAIVSESVSEAKITAEDEAENDELIAAFLALHLFTSEDIHDEESNVLTIDRIQRRYSPWSSKFYSMNNIQR